MKNLEVYESFGERSVVLESRRKLTITFDIQGGKIKNIVNNSGVRFPYMENEHYNRNIETWCCNNNFTMDGKDMCPEKKVFGIKQSQIPKGHELRTIFKNKFK